MRTTLLALPFAVALAGGVTSSLPAVDCNSVSQQVKAGRWAVDVAESTGLTLAQVNDCVSRSSDAAPGKAVPARHGAAATPGPSPRDGRKPGT